MTGTTKLTILAEAQARTGMGDITDIDSMLKSVMMDLSSSGPFLESSSTVFVAGTYVVDYPTDAIHINSVSDTIKALEWVPLNEWHAVRTAIAATGNPTRYTCWHNDILLNQTPTLPVTLTIYYTYEANDPDANPFTADFDEALIEGVCFKMYESKGLVGEHPAAMAHKQLYDDQKAVLIKRYGDRRP